MPNKNYTVSERRKYIRLDTVFPVQFRLVSLDGKQFLSDELQGFTNNIGKGGLCLAVNNLNAKFTGLIKEGKAKIFLNIELPVMQMPVPALANTAWVKDIDKAANKYLIGLNYTQIDSCQNRRIMRYARAKKLFVPAVFGVIFLLTLILAAGTIINMRLVKGNRVLVEQLVKIAQESSLAKQKVKEIVRAAEALRLKIQALESRIQIAETEKEELVKSSTLQKTAALEKMNELNNLVGKLTRDKVSLGEQLNTLQRQESIVTEELLRLDKKKSSLEKANLDKMYQWLKVHQNPATGLVISFEGDGDVKDWAFIYDQSLVMQAYTYFGDFERARKILDFFDKKAKRLDGLFLNAYYAADGSPAEYTVHSGPNIWLGIAILQYVKKSAAPRYIYLAEEIARGIINLQNQDKEGGLRGGPGVEWYATEHNLDAYAFFNMLYRVTGKAVYQEASNRVLNWIVQHTYDKKDVPIKRGKGDSTIATDTYAWSIASLGPEKLAELGMNPDSIIEFAEQNCGAVVSYGRPEGNTVKIKGFDFAAQKNLARGGIVSSEWTAQMVMAFKIMADFYYKKGLKAKAHSYEVKADEYMTELGNMIISSPSPSGQGESCLPYATEDFVDTGHGWMTPKGKSTGSVAGTAYTLFAYYNYNPLELKE